MFSITHILDSNAGSSGHTQNDVRSLTHTKYQTHGSLTFARVWVTLLELEHVTSNDENKNTVSINKNY